MADVLWTSSCCQLPTTAGAACAAAGHYLNRVYVMAAGCFIWGGMACLFAFCNSLVQVLLRLPAAVSAGAAQWPWCYAGLHSEFVGK